MPKTNLFIPYPTLLIEFLLDWPPRYVLLH